MDDYIIAVSIFSCTFVIICVVYDCILRSRMKNRMSTTWAFIHGMKDFVVPKEPVMTETPNRIMF